jgi:hypothetical protein
MKLKHVHLVRLSDEDHREVEATAGKLGLSPSEITRRSLRIALPILKDLALPGSPRRESESEPEPPAA